MYLLILHLFSYSIDNNLDKDNYQLTLSLSAVFHSEICTGQENLIYFTLYIAYKLPT